MVHGREVKLKTVLSPESTVHSRSRCSQNMGNNPEPSPHPDPLPSHRTHLRSEATARPVGAEREQQFYDLAYSESNWQSPRRREPHETLVQTISLTPALSRWERVNAPPMLDRLHCEQNRTIARRVAAPPAVMSGCYGGLSRIFFIFPRVSLLHLATGTPTLFWKCLMNISRK